jgi:predicted AAA+ superfamily ATPase
MTRKKLPIGIQTFAKIREDNYYYVDKTAFALRMIEEGIAYFLSRPRRFGKSLFLDTLAELFAGNESLFRELCSIPSDYIPIRSWPLSQAERILRSMIESHEDKESRP